MLYCNFKGLELPRLGVGAMRLPVLDGDDTRIDRAHTEKMIAHAMEQGANYFDTAYGYHGGQSEIVMGELLARYPRESFFLADKFPGYDLSNMDRVEAIFEEQLKKCGVAYFDFYMYHNVCEMNIDAYLNEQHGILAYLLKQKAAGRIRHLGFSAHGAWDVMERFLKACGDSMEFCQIQLNYLDWTFQDAKAKVALLEDYRIPVWVMEPLRGGRLANLSGEDAGKLKLLRPAETVPAWAFRFLQSIPSVKVVLSGMSSLEQLGENIKTFQEEKPLQEGELETLLRIAEGMVRQTALPCTQCRYCLDHCPQRLDIPSLLSLYNEHCFTGGGFLAPMALMAVPQERHPTACVYCRSCEAVCPQQLKIADAMADFSQKLRA